MTYSFIDYRNSISERNGQDIESKEWKTAQEKVNERSLKSKGYAYGKRNRGRND